MVSGDVSWRDVEQCSYRRGIRTSRECAEKLIIIPGIAYVGYTVDCSDNSPLSGEVRYLAIKRDSFMDYRLHRTWYNSDLDGSIVPVEFTI